VRPSWLIRCRLTRSVPLTPHARSVIALAEEAVAHGLEVCRDKQFFERQREEYAARRQVLMDVFDGLGLEYTRPDGSYFLLVDMSRFQIPVDYVFPDSINGRGRDFKYVCVAACLAVQRMSD
jgi:kynurenine aminotransferase